MTSKAALLSLLLPWAAAALGAPAEEPLAFKIVVNAANPGNAARRQTVADLFLKKATRWTDGAMAAPVDQSLTSKLRGSFSEQVLHEAPAAIHNYWQHQIFSGRDQPPPVKASDDEVLAYVQAHAGGIGYVTGTVSLPAGVKELKLQE